MALIKSDKIAGGPYGLQWDEEDAVVEVTPETVGLDQRNTDILISDLLRIPGFTEIVEFADEPEDLEDIPPLRGAGSGKDAWRAYAESKGLEDIPAEANREDIIERLTAAGIPTTTEPQE